MTSLRSSGGSRNAVYAALLAVLYAAALFRGCHAFVPTGGGAVRAGTHGKHPPAVRRTGGGTRNAVIAPGPVNDIETVGNMEEFERVVARPKQVVAVWFQASWCRKCKYIGSRLRHLDEHLPAHLVNNLLLVSVDVNKVAQVPQQQKIKDLPTIKFFVEGQAVGSYVATDRGEVFYNKVERHIRAAIGEDLVYDGKEII